MPAATSPLAPHSGQAWRDPTATPAERVDALLAREGRGDVGDVVRDSVRRTPRVEGPVPVTSSSHPFSAMSHSRGGLDLGRFGYIEEEYFLHGTANIYDKLSGSALTVVHAGVPYVTRVLVRRPENTASFSGRVYLDILNASSNYDIEDLWVRSYLWCMQNGHAYVGVTSKPGSVMSLKFFDEKRYRSLNWASPEPAAQPAVPDPVSGSIPGTEEGLVWDILSQCGVLLRGGGADSLLAGLRVEYLYLTGQSQSGAYLNTYVNHFHDFLVTVEGRRLFDGFFNSVGATVVRPLRQTQSSRSLGIHPGALRPVVTPTISVTAEGDLGLFAEITGERVSESYPPDRDTAGEKSRYYEVAGASHTDVSAAVLPSENEVAKTRFAHLTTQSGAPANDFPLAFYLTALLDRLHLWGSAGVAPPQMPLLARDQFGEVLKDEHGNAVGGLRSPFLDVPAATHRAFGETGDRAIAGTVDHFPRKRIAALYGSTDEYILRFSKQARQQVREGWVSAADAERMIDWAKNRVESEG